MRIVSTSLLALTLALSFSSAKAEDISMDNTMQALFSNQKVQTAAITSNKRQQPKVIQQDEGQMAAIFNEHETMFPSYAVIGNDNSRRATIEDSIAPDISMDPKFARQEVDFQTKEPAGSIIVNTDERMLYFVLGNGKALRYGVGVGRPGFEWGGTQHITRKAEWPDWRPPAEMLKRRPDLPRYMPGGPDNPLGARALYLGSSIYRIHGTNEDTTIGGAVSSGCIRMRNDDVEDLYSRAKVGAKVVVL